MAVVLRARRRRAARVDPAHRPLGGRERRRADRRDGRREPARALAGRPRQAGAGAEGAQAADGDVDAALGRGRVPLVAHALPDPRATPPRRACRSRSTRTSTTRPAWPPTSEPVTAWERQSDEVKRLADWIQGKEEVHITGRGTDIKLNVAGRTFIPCAGEHNMPDGEFFTGPVEDSVEGEVAFSFPATYGGREVSGVKLPLRGGQGGGRHRPSGARPSCTRCSTPTRARGAWASSGSAPTTASPPAPRRSCSTRRSAGPCTWRSG